MWSTGMVSDGGVFFVVFHQLSVFEKATCDDTSKIDFCLVYSPGQSKQLNYANYGGAGSVQPNV